MSACVYFFCSSSFSFSHSVALFVCAANVYVYVLNDRREWVSAAVVLCTQVNESFALQKRSNKTTIKYCINAEEFRVVDCLKPKKEKIVVVRGAQNKCEQNKHFSYALAVVVVVFCSCFYRLCVYVYCALLRLILRGNFVELVFAVGFSFWTCNDDDHYDFNVKTDSFNVHVICIDIISTRRNANTTIIQ